MSKNTIKSIELSGSEVSVLAHFSEGERPIAGETAYFTVYELIEDTYEDEGGWWTEVETKKLMSMPFGYSEENLDIILESFKPKLEELVNQKGLLIVTEKFKGQLADLKNV